MNKPALAAAAFAVLGLLGCSKSGGDAPAATAQVAIADTPPQAPAPAKPPASDTAGSIDMVITAETIDRNAKGDANGHQCQLNFEAMNNSSVDVASLIIEFDALPAAGGAPIGGKLNLTMPMKIAAGASQKAWGPVTIDNHTCSALQVSFPPQPGYQCRTSTKAPCAVYRYSATGVAIAG